MPFAAAKYRAIVSSDWNECLAPCCPFDCIKFLYPELKRAVECIFNLHKNNKLSLKKTYETILALFPHQITQREMDAYIDACFRTYNGVPDFIKWCKANGILFMINTTGMAGYFQRIVAKKLLPPIPILSANPLVKFPVCAADPQVVLELCKIEDKPKNTETMICRYDIPNSRAILLGDSAGDGPHFKWGAEKGAFLIGCMAKDSLKNYCIENGIIIDHYLGVPDAANVKMTVEEEMQFDFMKLTPHIDAFLARSGS